MITSRRENNDPAPPFAKYSIVAISKSARDDSPGFPSTGIVVGVGGKDDALHVFSLGRPGGEIAIRSKAAKDNGDLRCELGTGSVLVIPGAISSKQGAVPTLDGRPLDSR